MTKIFVTKCTPFQVSSFGFVSAFDIPASSLAFEISLLRYLPRNSSKAWRLHHQHRDHAYEKDEQHNCQTNKNSITNRVNLLCLTPEWRRMAKIAGRRFGQIRRLRLAEDKLSHARLNSSPKTSTMSNALRH
jgi:hypothetical protein